MLDGHAIAISPADPDKVILAVRMGLFETGDGGKSWQDMEVGRFSPTTYGRDIKVSPQDGNTLYAALSVAAASKDGGVYRSTDKGADVETFRQGAGARDDHVGRAASERSRSGLSSVHAMTGRSTAPRMAARRGIPCRCRRAVKDLYAVAVG